MQRAAPGSSGRSRSHWTSAFVYPGGVSRITFMGGSVSQSDPVGRTGKAQDVADESVLRAKYLEYCSAQLADLLLYLSPDEIFVLAEKAASTRGHPGEVSYLTMVEVATGWLSDRVALPPFDVWAADYRENPERYEAYFMGLWESEVSLRG